MYARIKAKLDKGQTIILDGGTGTDIQRRGAPMSGDTWCADANLTHPEIVRDVHLDYIKVGAEIIAANTFASSALSFNHYGRDDDLLRIDQKAVAVAREARGTSNVAVAGSISTMRPSVPGSDRTLKDREWPETEARQLFKRKAENLRDAGVDLLMMEMMRDCDYSIYATEAAMHTGLPVWVGISVERHGNGELFGFGREDQRFESVAQALSQLQPAVINIMHTSPNDTGDAIEILRKYWNGPIGAYPECGYFKSPDWVFVDIIPPHALVQKSREWQSLGASIFGGCCGIGPDHIRALATEFRS